LTLALDGRGLRALRPWPAWAGLIGFLALWTTCFQTAYNPVLNCQAESHQAEASLAKQEPDRAMAHLEAAATADPYSAEPWRQIAAIELGTWRERPDEAGFSRFTTARDNLLRLAPNSSVTWTMAGDWAVRAYAETDPSGRRLVPDAMRSAVEFYSRAVQLYPNNALHRAKLAEAQLAAGDRSAFRREAEAALRLDAITPHSDKKLPIELRERLQELLERKSP
jgi:tetratricopeptide (TPR) repeat protein